MKNVTFKFRLPNCKYKQITQKMELPKDNHGFILESELSKQLQSTINKDYPGSSLIWHKVCY